MSSPRPSRLRETALAAVVERAGACVEPSTADLDGRVVTGVTLDSRTVHPGDLYAALPGQHVHGARFAGTAVARGAAAVLTDPAGAELVAADLAPEGASVPVLVVADPRAVLGGLAAVIYGEPATRLRMYGITGTNGRTTTAYLLESALRTLGARTGLIGTVETRIGEDRLASARTTPEATDLHAILAVMLERDTDAVVMEVSSHAMAQHRVDGVVYDLALFTNLSQDHLDFHGDMAGYFDAKAALFTPARARRGLVCIDDRWGRELAGRSAVPVTTLATDSGADWTLAPGDGATATLTGPGGQLHLHCHLPGAFNVVNTAMAALALLENGYAAADVERAMAAEPAVPGRMEIVPGGPGEPRCIVDYAHTPEAVDAALAALRPSTPGRLVVVLGAGGDRDRGKRRAMGAAAARWADDLVVTDDNPRSEDPAAIRAEVLAGAQQAQRQDSGAAPDSGPRPPASATRRASDAGRAVDIAAAVRLAREQGRPTENTVVVLGKGHETGQEIAGVVHPFDDRDALAAALRGQPYAPEAAR